jgi:hypothetical protein
LFLSVVPDEELMDPVDRSDFDVQGAIENDEVWIVDYHFI